MHRFGKVALLFAAWLTLALGGAEARRAFAEEGNTIPAEFGGVRMGALLCDLEGMTFTRAVRVEDTVGGDYEVRYYTRRDAPESFGGVRLERVEYGFCEDYVCAIRAEASGLAAYEALVREYARIYGTEDRRVTLYGSLWDRYCDEEHSAGERGTRWILCEHETDNCAFFSIRHRRADDRTILLLGDPFAEP